MTSVNGVMSQENRTRNTAIGAGVGAAAGAGVGYLTKQIAKDGVLANDVFQSVVRAAEEANEEVLKPFKAVSELEKKVQEAEKAIKGLAADATEEARNAANKVKSDAETALFEAKKALVAKDTPKEKVEEAFNAARKNAEKTLTKTANIALVDSDVAKSLKEVVKEGKDTSIDDMKKVIKSYTDSKLNIEGLDKKAITEDALKDDAQVKGFFGKIQEAVNAGETNKKGLTDKIKGCFEENGKKLKDKFEEGSEKIGESIKKVMKSAKLKQAAIVGGIAAAALGLGAFLLSNKKADNNKQ